VTSFHAKTALLTGAAGGIGRATAITLAQRGCALVLVDNNAPGLAELVAELPTGANHLAITADVSSEDDVERVFAEARARFGTIQLLHNNAGILDQVGPLINTTAEGYDRLMSVNARSAFLFLRRFVALLVEDGQPGAIVNTASAAGLKGAAGLVAYSMSKQAIVGLTRSAAVETGEYGIRINAVCPGRVDTPMISGLSQLGPQDVVLASRPIGRPATPYEVAYLVVWLLSDEASFATGCIYPIDGGLTA
jgi:NAD(P)-dependent dehydrogenase (short-subunit alcohol dehydrogenase family)